MKLLVDISENQYKIVKEYVETVDDENLLANVIVSGTPLPKGHRRLIAEPTKEDIAKTIGGKNDFADCIRDSVKAVFDNAPTVIEAESEEV